MIYSLYPLLKVVSGISLHPSEISSEGVDTYLKNAITEQSEFDKLKSESKSLDEQIDELKQKQAAVLNSLS